MPVVSPGRPSGGGAVASGHHWRAAGGTVTDAGGGEEASGGIAGASAGGMPQPVRDARRMEGRRQRGARMPERAREPGNRVVKTVFFDIDTQIDFMFPAGALYVAGAETIVDRVAGLNRYAAANGIPLISTMDAHSENDPEFEIYPHHCVAGTVGQQKSAATLLENRVVVPNAPCDRVAAQI